MSNDEIYFSLLGKHSQGPDIISITRNEYCWMIQFNIIFKFMPMLREYPKTSWTVLWLLLEHLILIWQGNNDWLILCFSMVKIFHRYLNSNLFVLPMFLVILAKNSLENSFSKKWKKWFKCFSTYSVIKFIYRLSHTVFTKMSRRAINLQAVKIWRNRLGNWQLLTTRKIEEEWIWILEGLKRICSKGDNV